MSAPVLLTYATLRRHPGSRQRNRGRTARPGAGSGFAAPQERGVTGGVRRGRAGSAALDVPFAQERTPLPVMSPL